MRLRKPKLTYANVMSTLALFLALTGGVAVASTLSKNSVGTKQLKNHSVTTKKIKRNAITGSLIKTHTIKSSDIDLAHLGTVPTASATTDMLPTVMRKTLVSASNADPNVARTAATEIPLGSTGQVSLYGKCYQDTTADAVFASIYARTTANGSLLQSDFDDLNGDPFLDTTTLETDREVGIANAGAAAADNGVGAHSHTQVIGADGNTMSAFVQSFALNGPVAGGTGVYPAQESCIFMFQGTKMAPS